MKKAVIDLGTNTFHLVIGEVINGRLTIHHHEQEFVRLGYGGITKGFITDEAIGRGIATLTRFKDVIYSHAADETLAVGTSALRIASNQKEVLAKIFDATGISVKILSGEQEAKGIFTAVHYLFQSDKKQLIVDIGGGSTEFILFQQSDIRQIKSIEIGGQRMLDLMGYPEKSIQAADRERVLQFIHDKCSEFTDILNHEAPQRLIGVSGSFDTLLMIHQHIHDSAAESLSLEDFRRICHLLYESDREERLRIKGMEPKRVDMIVVASLMIEWVLSRLPSIEYIDVSKYALREGMLLNHEI